MQDKSTPRKNDRDERFMHHAIACCQQSKSWAARLRRADNPVSEHHVWDLLIAFNIDLGEERLPYLTLVAAMAKAKATRNGSLPFGRAIAACYDEGSDSEQAKTRLRRVLACTDEPELCRIVRPVLALINSRVSEPLDYVRLLRQMRVFALDAQRIKAQWAQEFYGRIDQNDGSGNNAESEPGSAQKHEAVPVSAFASQRGAA